MAGFTGNSRSYSSNNPNPVTRVLKKLSSFGMNYKDDVFKNVRSVDLSLLQQNISNGNTNSTQIGTINDENVQVLFARMSSTDPSLGKGYFGVAEESYQKKKEQIRKFALQDEIEEILDIICEESIVFDAGTKFANVKLNYKVDQNI